MAMAFAAEASDSSLINVARGSKSREVYSVSDDEIKLLSQISKEMCAPAVIPATVSFRNETVLV